MDFIRTKLKGVLLCQLILNLNSDQLFAYLLYAFKAKK